MPDLDRDDGIREYWEKVKHKYPDTSLEQFRDICNSPFDAVKDWIKSGTLPFILVKYLGKFVINSTKVLILIKRLDTELLEGKITPEYHAQWKKYYQDYLVALEIRKATKFKPTKKSTNDTQETKDVSDTDNQGGETEGGYIPLSDGES